MTDAAVHTLSDTELISLTRAGDPRAFAELWNRHHAAGRSFARTLCRFDADDVVAESFARIFRATRAGGGPQAGFRSYLFTSIRNLVAEWARRDRETATLEPELLEDDRFSESSILATIDRDLTVRAFRTLPERWQQALWYSEVEGLTNIRVAELLALKPNAVAQLTRRAKEGLREAWIRAHLATAEPGSEHAWVIDRLAVRARHRLPGRDARRMEAHLDACAACTLVAAEAEQTASRLRVVLLPLLIAGAGAGAFDAFGRGPSATARESTARESTARETTARRLRGTRSSQRLLPRWGGAVAVGVAGLVLTSGAFTTPVPLLPPGTRSPVPESSGPSAPSDLPLDRPVADSSSSRRPAPDAGDGDGGPGAGRTAPGAETSDPDAETSDASPGALPTVALPAAPLPTAPGAGADLPVPPPAPPTRPAPPTYAVTAQTTMPAQGSGVAIDSARGLVYVAARWAGAVYVYDETTMTLLRTVAVPNEPYGIAVGPAGHVYVSQYTGNNQPGTLSTIALGATAVTSTVATGRSPVGVTLSRDARLLYVANYSSPFLSVFDLSDAAAPSASAPLGLQNAGETVTQSPDATTLFVASPLSNSVEVLDARTGAHRATWTGLSSPHQVGLGADAESAVVTQQLGTAAAVFSVAANARVAEVALPNAYYLSEDPALGLRFISQPFTAGGSLAVVDQEGRVLQSLTGITGAYYAATDPATGVTFVTSLSSNALTRVGATDG